MSLFHTDLYDLYYDLVNHETSLKVIQFIENNESLLIEFREFNQSDEEVETEEKKFFDLIDGSVIEFLSGGRIIEGVLETYIKEKMSETDSLMRRTESELGKRDLLCRFIRDILWCATYEEVKFNDHNLFDRLKYFGYRAAECNNIYASFLTTLAKVELKLSNFKKARENIKKALDCTPDYPHNHESERLWIYFIEVCMIENEHVTNSQEILEKALISVAYGYEIYPFKWIKAAIIVMRKHQFGEKIIIEVLTSLKGTFSAKKLVEEFSQDNKKVVQLYLIAIIEADLTRKHLWVRAIFYKNINEDDLKRFFKIACINCPNDENLRNLIQAKISWNEKKYAAAQRLFNKVKEDTKWKNFIADNYSQFYDEIKGLRSYRHKELKVIIELDPSDEDKVRRRYSIYWRLPKDLKDEWLLGEHKLVQEVLAKAVSDCPDKKDFWLMKVQIETKLEKLDQLANTFENAIESVNSCDAIDFYLKFSEFEERRGNLLKAENVLESGISQATEDSDKVRLYIAKIHFKRRMNEEENAQTLLTQAMNDHSESGELWAEAISMEARSERREKAAEALEKCGDDENQALHVMLATAKYFFSLQDVESSRKWFNKIVDEYPYFGDAWIYLYKFEKIYSWLVEAREVMNRFILILLDLEENKFCEFDGKEWKSYKDSVDYWGFTNEELLRAIVDEKIGTEDVDYYALRNREILDDDAVNLNIDVDGI